MSATYFPKTFFGFLQKIYCFLESIPLLGWPFQRLRPAIEKLLLYTTRPQRREQWFARVELVRRSTDNQFIPKVPNAGKVEHGNLILHNGIKVRESSYAGEGMRLLMKRNGGVHEPQEERYFQEVLKLLPEKPVMLELGAWWGFYSLWLKRERPQARCILVEPNASNLMYGKINFRLNDTRGEFFQAFVDKTESSKRVEGVRVESVDSLFTRFNLNAIDVLHADIQGYELAMLQGALRALTNQTINYLFISTHGDALHGECVDFLKSFGYTVAVDIPPSQAYSVDGILVAVHPAIANYPRIELSRNRDVVIPVTL